MRTVKKIGIGFGIVIAVFLIGGTIGTAMNYQEKAISSNVEEISKSSQEPEQSIKEQTLSVKENEVGSPLHMSQSEDYNSTSLIQDTGDFYAVYSDISNPKLQKFGKQVKETKALETIVDRVNRVFKLPYNVPVIFLECGTPNAYYDPNKKELVFCYELLAYYFLLFQNLGYDDFDVGVKGGQVFAFVVYHELGHALIDVYELPITGMEEDAVDQLATLYISKQKSDKIEEIGLSTIKTTATWFAYESVRESKSGQLPFWDEHSLNQQRFYNILCWMYGSSPTEYSNLVSDGLLPKERAVKCPSEYEKLSKSWKSLLLPYIKDPSSSVLFRN